VRFARFSIALGELHFISNFIFIFIFIYGHERDQAVTGVRSTNWKCRPEEEKTRDQARNRRKTGSGTAFH